MEYYMSNCYNGYILVIKKKRKKRKEYIYTLSSFSREEQVATAAMDAIKDLASSPKGMVCMLILFILVVELNWPG